MMITTGTRLGPYEIASPLGAGGMGEVYRARDARLGRDVALKILPESVSRDADRLRRFEQEARAAAALNHPYIAHIYEIGESDGARFIAMEYVEGETLRAKIHRERAPLRKLLQYLTQVAEGLSKAHSAGIIHRDLKPDNVMITPEGFAKILDFGLAKLVEPHGAGGDQASSEVATALLQQHSMPGMVMGTIGYMSPEQAQGRVREIDQRSDIFSFGCILYEAATGRRAFEGKDAIDSLHKLVHAPAPQLREANPDAPEDLQRIVRRCLAKDPERRYQSIKEVAIELEELQQQLSGDDAQTRAASTPAAETLTAKNSAASTAGVGQTTTAAIDSAAARHTSSAEYLLGGIRRHRAGTFVALAALAVAAAAVAFGVYQLSGRGRDASAVPFRAGKFERLTMTGKASDAIISPDGKYVVYVQSEGARASLWVRFIATNSDVQIVAPAEGQYRGLSFSPDGNYIYYARSERLSPVGVLYQIAVLGGSPKRLVTGVNNPVAVSPDGKQLAFVRTGVDEDAMVLANSDGTGERNLAVLKRPEALGGGGGSFSAVSSGAPAWSPDGKIIACSAILTDGRGANNRTIAAVSVADGTVRSLTAQGPDAVGRIAWLHDGSGLVVVMRDDETGQLNYQLTHISYPGGESHRITRDVNIYGDVSVTEDAKALVTVQSDPSSNVWLVPVDQPALARQITSGKLDGYCGVAWTPDGKIVFASRKIREADLWVMNADGGGQKQFMDDIYTDRYPSVTPDGRYIVFDSLGRGGTHVWRMEADGGNLKQLTAGGGEQAPQVSPDGRWVVYQGAGPSIWKVSIDGGQPVRLTDKHTTRPAVSPDGKLIACYYRDVVTSPFRLALIPFEGGDPVKVFDTPVGAPWWVAPRWTPDGRAILYADDRGGAANIWSQPIAGGEPKRLTEFASDNIYSFGLSRDGRQLAIARGSVSSDVVVMSESK
jgi:serine/threonine protein kinase/Tol biopolymer transport system component